MDVVEPKSISPELLRTDDGTETVHIAPPVVAVVVTQDPGSALDETLAALAAQDYPSLSVLVVDNGSADDPTARIATAMPHAFVRRRPAGGFAAAANDALDSVEGAMFLLFCHDNVAPDADAVRILVEEAYRSNAAIVGPKIVDHDHPEILLEVGMAVDHYGVPYSGIEPDEVDQEQHDAVRDVFFVSHAAMLVRTDLFHELDGFDPATFPGADDIDLCWRARLAGARIVVAPEARVRKYPGDKDARDIREETRSRVRLLCKSYSGLALVWVLPVSFVLGLAESFWLLVTGRARRAGALLAGGLAPFAHFGGLRKARARTQRLRKVEDSDVRDLMIRGSARVREFFSLQVHAGERLAEVSTRTRARMDAARSGVRRAPVIVALLLGALVLLGVRSLLFGRVPEVGAFRAWPGIGNAWATFTASWHSTFMGSSSAASPAFGLMAAVTTVLLGHAGLARSLVVSGALPLGAWGVYRLVRPVAPAPHAAVAAAVVYGANPIARNAIWQGELGPLVCFALAPFLFAALMRGSDDETPRQMRVHAALSVALLLAIVTSVWPIAIVFVPVIALAFVLVVPFTGDARFARRGVVLAAIATIGAIALCTPWIWSLLGADGASLGLQPRAPLSLANILQFHSARAGAGFAPWGIIVAAAVPLAIASGVRLAWAMRAWMLALLSFATAWLPSRISASAHVPAPEGVLVGAALGLAVAAGIGVAAVLDDLRRLHFGWRQVLAIVAMVGVIVPMFGLAGDVFSGRFGLHSDDWATKFAWMHDDPHAGGFRVLWLGDPNILPADTKLAGATGFALTRNGPGDARALLAAPQGHADRVVERAISDAEQGATSRLGHLLAPAGVRYIAFITRAAPSSGAVGAPQPGLSDALVRQLDLSLSRIDANAVVYENDAWIPTHATAPTATDVSDALRVEPAGIVGVHVTHGLTEAIGPGTLLWSEAANGGWHARQHGSTVARTDAFATTNAFALNDNAPVSVHYRGSLLSGTLRFLAVLAWLAAFAAWISTRRRRVRSV